MGSIFDLDLDGKAAQDEAARLNPLDPATLPAEGFDGLGQSFKGFMRPSAAAGRSLMLAVGGAAVVTDTARNAITGGDEMTASDWVFGHVDDLGNNAVDYWTPNPEAMGSTAKVVNMIGNVAGSVPQMIGMPGVFLGNAGLDPAVELQRQGVDTGTALAVGGINLAINAAGMRLPAAFGSTLGTRVATGAGSNVALGVAGDAATKGALAAGGYEDQAAGYDLTDPYARGLDLLMGVAFAGKAHIDSPLPPSQRDAVLVANNHDHLQRRTLPGQPTGEAGAAAHDTAINRAMQQLLAGDRVNVADAVNPADFILRPEAQDAARDVFHAQAAASGDAYGRMLVALESGGVADAKAPTSSATGLHQFTNTTWLRTVRKAAPEWAQGLDDAQILAQRTNPERSAQMEGVLRAENAAALTKAGQDAADPFNLYAAHHFGSSKAVAFAKAADDTPMSAILTEGQLNANPYLKGLTKAEAIANWTGRAKRAGVAMDAPVARAEPEPVAGLADVAPRPQVDATPAPEAPTTRMQGWADDVFDRLDVAPRNEARTTAFGIEIERTEDGNYRLTDTRGHAGPTDGETMDRAAATRFVQGAAKQAEQRAQALQKTAPSLIAAERAAADQPGLQVLEGFDGDMAPRYRPMAESLAEIEGDRLSAANDAKAYEAAAACFLRRDGNAA